MEHENDLRKYNLCEYVDWEDNIQNGDLWYGENLSFKVGDDIIEIPNISS